MILRRLLCLIVASCSIFASTQNAAEEVTKTKLPQILLVGFIPGEHASENCPARLQFTQMENVHCLDRWDPGVYGPFTPFSCGYHKVDWLDKTQWNAFVEANKGKFDLVIFDQRVAHHFAGIENFGETFEGKTSNASEGIHRNFDELLASGADVYIPICEYPYPADQVIDPVKFTNYCKKVESHFADCGLRSQRTYDRRVFDMNAEHLEANPRLSIARQFLGNHPLIKIQLQRTEVVIFLWHFKAV